MTETPLWRQFRRLLLGSVVEGLLDAGVAVDFGSIRIRFDDASVFRVPRLDNYMRFVGVLTATVRDPPPPAALDRLRVALRTLWPELLSVLDLPIGDALTAERTHLDVTLVGDALTIRFDLSAD